MRPQNAVKLLAILNLLSLGALFVAVNILRCQSELLDSQKSMWHTAQYYEDKHFDSRDTVIQRRGGFITIAKCALGDCNFVRLWQEKPMPKGEKEYIELKVTEWRTLHHYPIQFGPPIESFSQPK